MQTLSPAWNLSPASTNKWYARAFPSLTDVAFLLPIFALFVKLKGTKTLFSDGDTGWHIRTGEWIIQHRAVPTHDLFSFTHPNQDWFAWEWAWDVLFGAVHNVAGLGGVGFLNVMFLAILSVFLFTLARRVSRNDVISFFVASTALCASSVHWLARPHLVSLLFAVAFLHLIQSAEEGNRKALYFAPILMVLWTNLHGGFVAGIVILVCQAVGLTLSHLLAGDAMPRSSAEPSGNEPSGNEPSGKMFGSNIIAALRYGRSYWIAASLSLAATFVNPYGWRLHQHIFLYLTNGDLLDRISEFQSISFHSGAAPLFEIMLVLGAFAAFWKLQSAQIAPALAIVVWAHLALFSARHIPLFAIVAAPPIASMLHDVVQRLRHVRGLSGAAITFSEICEELRLMEGPGRLHAISAVGVLFLAALFAAGKEPFSAEFDSASFPEAAIPFVQARLSHELSDRNGKQTIQSGSRIFTYDQWGDYLIYRLYPAQKVFFDGRSDFYGIDFVRINQRIVGAEHDWKKLLQSFDIEMVILKPDAPLSAVLKITPGAKVLFDDGKVVVFRIDGIYPRSLATPVRPGETEGLKASPSQIALQTPWYGGRPPAQEVFVRRQGETKQSRSRLSATAHIV